MLDVLCCCKPENVMGAISREEGLNAGLELRETVDEEGEFGEAFVYDESTETLITPVREKHRKGGKTWRGK